jgi:hypothetical protein
MESRDILFYVSDFLNDKDAFRLFNTCRYYTQLVNKYPNRYKAEIKYYNFLKNHKCKTLSVGTFERFEDVNLDDRLVNYLRDFRPNKYIDQIVIEINLREYFDFSELNLVRYYVSRLSNNFKINVPYKLILKDQNKRIYIRSCKNHDVSILINVLSFIFELE